MTQTLVTRNSDNAPLDFGISVVFDAQGVHVLGRADSPNYRGPIFERLTLADVTQSSVADDYAIPAAPPVPKDQSTYAVLDGADFLVVIATALGFARADYLMDANAVIRGFITHPATRIMRTGGMTPQAITFLKSLATSPLTDSEMAAIDAVWATRV